MPFPFDFCTAESIKICVLVYPQKKCRKEKPHLTTKGPKNLNLYLEAEKLIFMSSIQYAVVM